MLTILAIALADSTGVEGLATEGCGSCHGAAADSTTTVTLTPGSVELPTTASTDIDIVVSTSDPLRSWAGLNASAASGVLLSGSNTRAAGAEVTHRAPEALVDGSATFTVRWVSPSLPGAYSVSVAGLVADGDGSEAGDGWNLGNVVIYVGGACGDEDGDRSDDCLEDCDPADATVYPGAPELCDGVDQDCDGMTDEDATGGGRWFADTDGDGYGDVSVYVDQCSPPEGYVENADDCDDTDASWHPGAAEACGSGLDTNCDGALTEDTGDTTWYADADGDGFGDVAISEAGCDRPEGHVENADDCDDGDAAVNPDADEVCGGVDDDCDGLVDDADDDVRGAPGWFPDGDGDGFGAGAATHACEQPPATASTSGDCDDANSATSPRGAEVCDGTDNNCDGLIDAGASDASTWYTDSDGDGWGDSASAVRDCVAPAGTTGRSGDCDDADDTVHPDAAETDGDGVDQDCDGADDAPGVDDTGEAKDTADTGPAHDTGTEPETGEETAGDTAEETAESGPYSGTDTGPPESGSSSDDADGDGYASSIDCDDTDRHVNPGAGDTWYDGVDQNCDGRDDYDQDGDGHASDDYGGTDCDDLDATQNPDAEDEPYDGVSRDCSPEDEFDADLDEVRHTDDCDDTDPSVGLGEVYYPDADRDTYGNGDFPTHHCEPPTEAGWVTDGTDCDDGNQWVHPDNAEQWYDGIDSDCDGWDDYDQDRDGHPRSEDCDDGDAAYWKACPEEDTSGETAETSGETADTGDSAPEDTDPPDSGGEDDGGCGCAAPVGGAGWGLLGALGLWFRRRR